MDILTVGIIKDHIEGRRLNEIAILQVCCFQKIIGERVVYRLRLSDGKYAINTGFLTSELFSGICFSSIIKITSFVISVIPKNNNSLIIVYDIRKYQVLNKRKKLIGSPTTLDETYKPLNKISRPVPKNSLKNIIKNINKFKLNFFQITWTGQIIDIDNNIIMKQCPKDKKMLYNIVDDFYCKQCKQFYNENEYKYLYFIKLKIRDSSKRICSAVCFGSVGNQILGKTAKEMVDLQKRNELEYKYYIASKIYLTYTLKLELNRKYKKRKYFEFSVQDVITPTNRNIG